VQSIIMGNSKAFKFENLTNTTEIWIMYVPTNKLKPGKIQIKATLSHIAVPQPEII